MVLCAKIRETYVYPLAEKPDLHPNLTCVHGEGGFENPITGGYQTLIPGVMWKSHPCGCCGNPGICLKFAQGQKCSKCLPRATRCTDRAQTFGNMTPRTELCPPNLTFRVKVRARRDVSDVRQNRTITHAHTRFTSRTWFPGGGNERGEHNSQLYIYICILFAYKQLNRRVE